MVGLTSLDLIHKAHRLGLIMDLACDGADPATMAELDAEASEILETLASNVPDKMDALRAVLLRLQSEADLMREEEKLLAAKRRARQNAADRVKAFMLSLLQGMRDAGEGHTVKTSTNTFWLQSSQKLEGPEDPHLWPMKFQRTTVSPDRKAATKALKDGDVIDGFRLVSTEGVRFR